MRWRKRQPTREDAPAIHEAIWKSAQRKRARALDTALSTTSEITKVEQVRQKLILDAKKFELLSHYRVAVRLAMDELHITQGADRKALQRLFIEYVQEYFSQTRERQKMIQSKIFSILDKYNVSAHAFEVGVYKILPLIQFGKKPSH